MGIKDIAVICVIKNSQHNRVTGFKETADERVKYSWDEWLKDTIITISKSKILKGTITC